jgi:hypothetical protein
MGSAIGFAVATRILNTYLRSHLSPFLSAPEISSLLQNTQTVSTLNVEKQELVRRVFGEGYNLQFRIATGVAGAQFFATGIVWGGGKLLFDLIFGWVEL